MKVEIFSRFTPEGRQYYEWDLWDGPDGIDHVHGFASDLIHAFSKIMEWRERIGADYAADVEADLKTLHDFITNNETDCGSTD
jgi:hypothetical protein